jgi:hypothetical protein
MCEILYDMDILDLFPKYRRTTFQHLKKEDLPKYPDERRPSLGNIQQPQ